MFQKFLILFRKPFDAEPGAVPRVHPHIGSGGRKDDRKKRLWQVLWGGTVSPTCVPLWQGIFTFIATIFLTFYRNFKLVIWARPRKKQKNLPQKASIPCFSF